MDFLAMPDWQAMFMTDTPLLEIFIRGSVMYLALFFMLRFILKRQSGAIGVTDLLVVVMLADAAQNGMSDDYRSIPDGILLVGTLIFWNYLLEWLAFHFPKFEKLIQPAPLPLIKHGRMNRKNMRSELISEEDLMSQLRHHGIEDIHQVKSACMEGDGKISIIEYKPGQRKISPVEKPTN